MVHDEFSAPNLSGKQTLQKAVGHLIFNCLNGTTFIIVILFILLNWLEYEIKLVSRKKFNNGFCKACY